MFIRLRRMALLTLSDTITENPLAGVSEGVFAIMAS
nr:MAG TPA: hypothetical protein [Caudoviricetes sp.]